MFTRTRQSISESKSLSVHNKSSTSLPLVSHKVGEASTLMTISIRTIINLQYCSRPLTDFNSQPQRKTFSIAVKVLCMQEQLDASFGERKGKNVQHPNGNRKVLGSIPSWIPADFSFSLQNVLYSCKMKHGSGLRAKLTNCRCLQNHKARIACSFSRYSQ